MALPGAILTGLGGAVSFGAGDFWGGLAGRRIRLSSILLAAQSLGLVVLAGAAFWVGEAMPERRAWLFGVLAGVTGALGLLWFYRAMALGPMSIVSPLSAVIAAIVPVPLAILTSGAPKVTALAGMGLALVGIWLVSTTKAGDSRISPRALLLTVSCGLAFGVFLILIAQATQEAVLWPLVGARLGALLLVVPLVLVRDGSVRWDRGGLLLSLGAGLGDSLGNLFFALTAKAGRLDTAAVIVNCYPAVTLLLALVVLKERLRIHQAIGLAAILGAVALLAL